MPYQQGFSQALPPLPHCTRLLKRPEKKNLLLASPGDSYHSYDRFIPFASQNKFLPSLGGT